MGQIGSMKVALCFWGLCRSTDLTIQSIQTCIFKPLEDAGIQYDIYLHTYTLYRPYSNPRAKEEALQLKNTAWKLLQPTQEIIEDQDEVDRKLDLKKYRTKGNPWPEDPSYTTLDNHIRALWSLKQVTSLWLPKEKEYSCIVYLRPDVKFKRVIKPEWVQNLNAYTVRIPNFHLVDGCNDRFAIGSPSTMRIYGNRFHNALQYSYCNQLHSERFLAYELKQNRIQIEYILFPFIRIRANGQPCYSDINL
jgi:hypothetical protein